ncbi:Uncharacterised protein [Agrobacterium tumefaciens]|nr:Uncharacterised protein [Agrobacterium tumefaciens]
MLRTTLAVLTALTLSTSLVHAQSPWTGGDELPTNPAGLRRSARISGRQAL